MNKHSVSEARERSRTQGFAFAAEPCLSSGDASVFYYADGVEYGWNLVKPLGPFSAITIATCVAEALERALPMMQLANDEATEALVSALESRGVDGLGVLRENRAAAVESGRQ